MTTPEISFEEIAARYGEVRSLARWPSTNHVWSSLDKFLDSAVVESGIHSILLGELILDIYIEVRHGAPAYVHFHGNCPRAAGFKLPVFSGSNVLGSLKVTKIVPSDPVLLLEDSLELSWHAGSSSCNLQAAYRAIFGKVFAFTAATEVVFWGGSGGGFAALYYSYFFPGSTAMVWNPQTRILGYLVEPVNKYLRVAFGTTLDDVEPIPREIEHDVSRLYRNGYENRIIYIQNDEDWHVAEHLGTFLGALNVDCASLESGGYDGIVAPNAYLFVGNFSKDHQPPSNVEIHYALQECHSVHGDPLQFTFGRLINKRHGASCSPSWVVEALLSRRMDYFRPDWPHYSACPAVDTATPYGIVLSTGVVIDASPDGEVDWRMAFDRDVSTNIHELYSLVHVGRLLSAYCERKDSLLLEAGVAILRHFLAFIKSPQALELVMTNRGYSSADHSMSIRANVLVKLLQTIQQGESRLADGRLIDDAAGHLWDIADYLADPKHIYPSNHGIMSCLTLAQVANQFRELRYVSDHYLRHANTTLIGLIRASFDRDGWANENTVGYHSFILRLIRDYIEYSTRNGLEGEELGTLKEYLRRGEQALAYCVRQDGSIPPIGDSPLYRPGLPSINHSKLFAESGFLIVKDATLYLSLICGSRSDNHKQVDDSSLTLHYDGEDLIVDGGSYCYDSNDPCRKYLVSFRGHSGLFPESACDLSAKLYLLHRKSASIEEFWESVEGRFAKARYRLDLDNFECQRRIWIDYDGRLVISDRTSADNPATVVYQSFMLAPQMRLVENGGSYLVFEGDRYGIVISQFNASGCVVEYGLSDPVVAGWCSVNWREKEKTYQVRFSQKGLEANFLTKLQVFKRGSLTSTSWAGEWPSPEVMSLLKI